MKVRELIERLLKYPPEDDVTYATTDGERSACITAIDGICQLQNKLIEVERRESAVEQREWDVRREEVELRRALEAKPAVLRMRRRATTLRQQRAAAATLRKVADILSPPKKPTKKAVKRGSRRG